MYDTDLQLILKNQMDLLLNIKVYNQLHLSRRQYREELLGAIRDFEYNNQWGEYCRLNQPVIVDYRLSLDYLLQHQGIQYFTPIDYNNIEAPNQIMVIQGQFGIKDCIVDSVSWEMDLDYEQGCVLHEGLMAVLFYRDDLFDIRWDRNIFFPGSISPKKAYPSLKLYDGKISIGILGTLVRNSARFASRAKFEY